jgi:hypothetical protein
MLILKIKQKGLYIEIPGTLPARSPVDVDITKCNISIVDVYLRKNGITNYEIISGDNKKQIVPKPEKMADASIDQKVMNKRFSNLEKLMVQLLEKQQAIPSKNPEQITDKLDKLELLSKKILKKEPKVIERTVQTKTKVKRVDKEPEIEELEDTFIPAIDTSKMKMKSGSKKTVKQDKHDIDDSADLLSRIMGQED